MKTWAIATSISALSILTVSCGQKNLDKRVPVKIEESFQIAGDASLMESERGIAIAEKALGEEFLLQASIMNQIPLAMSSGLKSRIVFFEKMDEYIVMSESEKDHMLNDNFPVQLILARFPITAIKDGFIYFDFAEGMSQVFVDGDWYSASQDPSYSSSFRNIDIAYSFLESVDFRDDKLIIRQFAQIENPSEASFVEVKYYLEPYVTNPNFKPTAPADMKKMGFFTTLPRYEAGKVEAYATKFDVNKGIKFGVSANTPEEYKQAVKEGILYWNKAFSSDAIEVVEAAAGVTAPDFDLNMIQWVDWDDAGFAYADAQSDPRTGEILHAQVFMTSVFAASSKKRAELLLKRLEERPEAELKLVGLRGMLQKPLCDRFAKGELKQFLSSLVRSELSDERILEISKDYVREVIAHEVGHTLGLRHNFAGSLFQNYSPKEREALFDQYVTSSNVANGVIPASSVMEYQAFEDATMSGDIIEKGFAALEYDRMVIESLYEGAQYELEQLPVFCSDSRGFVDCQTFDIGRSLVESQAWNMKRAVGNFAQALAGEYVSAKQSDRRLNLSSDYWASRYFSNHKAIFSLLEQNLRILKVRRYFDQIDEYNEDLVRQKELDFIEEELKDAGLSSIVELFAKSGFMDLMQVKQLVLDDLTMLGVLDEYEILDVKADLDRLFTRMQDKLVLEELDMLASPSDLIDAKIGDDYLSYLESRVSEIVLETSNETMEGKFLDTEQVYELPVFKYEFEARSKALDVLFADRGVAAWKLKLIKARLASKLDALQEKLFGENLPQDYTLMDASLAKWLIEYKTLSNQLR